MSVQKHKVLVTDKYGDNATGELYFEPSGRYDEVRDMLGTTVTIHAKDGNGNGIKVKGVLVEVLSEDDCY